MNRTEVLERLEPISRTSARQVEHQRQLLHHLEQDLKRLEYAARRAEKQYHCVDPENRLIAATLEKRWEAALAEVEAARGKLNEAQQAVPEPVVVPTELREAFADAGRRLPQLWPTLSLTARKSLLRTLVRGVHLARQDEGRLLIRIVWRGGLASEQSIRVRVLTWHGTAWQRRTIERIEQLAAQGLNHGRIAETLNAEGQTPCRGSTFTPGLVTKLAHEHHIHSNLQNVRRREVPGVYTVREMATVIGVHPSWIYREIGRGRVNVARDIRYGCYLFPRTCESVATMKQLRRGMVSHASFPKVHHDG